MPDETRPTGRDAVVRAAVQLLGSADLTQVLGFLSYRAVAREAHVRPGTVEYHVASKHELDLAAITAAVSFYGRVDHTPILSAVSALADGTGDLAALAAAMGRELEVVSPAGERAADLAGAGMAAVLATAAAVNDPDAAALMRSVNAQSVAAFAAVHGVSVAATGRDWRPPYDAARFAQLTHALVTGFMYLRRYETDGGSVELFVDAWLRLFLAATQDVTDAESDTLDRVAARFGAVGTDDEATRARIVDVARRVHAERGWLGLTESAVAEQAGVTRVEVFRLVGDRRELAAAIWAGKLARLERTLVRLDAVASLESVVRGFLEELVDAAREDMALTAAFLEGLWASTARGAAAAAAADEPHLLATLTALLVPRIDQRRDQLVLDDLGLEPSDLAAMLVGYGLYMSYSRASWSPERVVEVIVGSTYRGLAQPTTP